MATKKYPLFRPNTVVLVRNAYPNSWMGTNKHVIGFKILGQWGYTCGLCDGRGTGYKGPDFKKVTYKEVWANMEVEGPDSRLPKNKEI